MIFDHNMKTPNGPCTQIGLRPLNTRILQALVNQQPHRAETVLSLSAAALHQKV
jgi:hypothetical protein